jgi:lipopolysaccharide export system protein LptA
VRSLAFAAALAAAMAAHAEAAAPSLLARYPHPPTKPARAAARAAKAANPQTAAARSARAQTSGSGSSQPPATASVSANRAPIPGLADGNNGKPVSIEADNGIEWQQNNRVYIARGNAIATRGDDTVKADTLAAFYRPVAGAAPPPTSDKNGTDPTAGGSTEIYRLDATGNVVFRSPTDTMFGDHGVYDVDKSLLVVTGKGLKIVTPTDVITARDSLEWYDTQQIGVARGNAVAMRGDRIVRADVLTARVEKQADGTSHISRVDAHGNVVVSSPGQIARGDAGVYDLDTGIVTLTGRVRLTRGENEMKGRYAVVDLNNNVSRLLPGPPGATLASGTGRVQALIVPRQKPGNP